MNLDNEKVNHEGIAWNPLSLQNKMMINSSLERTLKEKPYS
jgi:hypothetical protein